MNVKKRRIFKSPLLSQFITQQRMNWIVPRLKGDVLDLGCGVGKVAQYVTQGCQYVGIDRDPRQLERLSRIYSQYIFYLRNFDSEPLELDSQFDTIVMAAIIEHLAKPEFLISQIKKYIKPNGTLLLTTPSPMGDLIHRWGAKLGLFYQEAVDEHQIIYNQQRLQQVFLNNGFTQTCFKRFLLGGNQFAQFRLMETARG